METNELVPSVSVAAVINARAAIMERFEKVCELVAEAQAIAQANGYLSLPSVGVDTYRNRRGSQWVTIGRDDARAAFQRELDASGWQHLMNATGLMSFMDADTKAKWHTSVHDGEIPELTARNVEATFLTLHANRGDMFEKGVINCFKKLNWDYKTNSPFKFGKRIVLRYFKDWSDATSPAYEAGNRLADLVRVLTVLDGKPEPDHRHDITREISAAMALPGNRHRGSVDTEYLHVKWFKNRAAHVTFTRPELVDRMNAIIAKHYPGALPAPQE